MISEQSYQVLDKLLAGCFPPNTQDVEQVKQCHNNFQNISRFIVAEDLTGARYILYMMLEKVYMFSGTINWQYIDTLFNTNAKKFVRSKYVDIAQYMDTTFKLTQLDSDFDVERLAISTLYTILEEKFKEYSLADINAQEVELYLHQFLDALKMEATRELLMKSNKIFFEGDYDGKTFLQGLDVLDYLRMHIASLEETYALDNSGLIEEAYIETLDDLERIEEANKGSFSLVTEIGIPHIDEAYSGLRSSELLGIMGCPGAGKSRLTASILYTAVTKFKQNIYYWSGEQGILELMAYFISKHAWIIGGRVISDGDIAKHLDKNTDFTLSDEDLAIYTSARANLLGGEYGSYYLDSTPLAVEELDAKLRHLHRKYNFSIFTLDYVSLIISNGKNIERRVYTKKEIIDNAMAISKTIAKQLNVSGIVVNQLNTQEIERLLSGKEASVLGGGDSSGYFRYLDKSIVISYTDKLKALHKVRLHSPKSRKTESFKTVVADANAGCCEYTVNLKDSEDNEDEYDLV